MYSVDTKNKLPITSLNRQTASTSRYKPASSTRLIPLWWLRSGFPSSWRATDTNITNKRSIWLLQFFINREAAASLSSRTEARTKSPSEPRKEEPSKRTLKYWTTCSKRTSWTDWSRKQIQRPKDLPNQGIRSRRNSCNAFGPILCVAIECKTTTGPTKTSFMGSGIPSTSKQYSRGYNKY